MKISAEFEIRPYPPCGCPWAFENTPKDLLFELGVCPLTSLLSSFFIFDTCREAGRHKSSNWFEIRPDLTTDCGVSCN